MPVVEGSGPFIGRGSELEALRAELTTARSGEPRVVLIEGVAGIGKTVLIDQLLAAEPDLIVLRANGEPLEADVAYGVMDQIIRAAGVSTARLAAGWERTPRSAEPVGVGVWLLEVLGDLAQQGPVAVVVDDAQWADVDSLRALLFAVRRLVEERVLVVLGHRTEHASRLPDGLRRLAGGSTGGTLTVAAMPVAQIHELAGVLGIRGFTVRAAQRLHAHTEGNPLFVTTILAELPERRWRTGNESLPAPRVFAAQVQHKLESCRTETRTLVEAVAVLGSAAPVRTAAMAAGVSDLVAALDEAVVDELLRIDDEFGTRVVSFPHPLVQAAVYEQLTPRRRAQLHAAAAELVEDEGASLRHRVLAATPPDPVLAARLEAFARREQAVGAWASAAWALVGSSDLSPDRTQREQRLLQAVDASIGAGDLIQAEAFARDISSFSSASWRDAVLGYLAVLRGRRTEAEELLGSAWRRCQRPADAAVAAVTAQRLALHGVGRLRGGDVVEWSGRAVSLVSPGDSIQIEAETLLGLGLGWQGRLAEGVATYERVLGRVPAADDGSQLDLARMAYGWLRLVGDDVLGARDVLAVTAPAAVRAGSVRVAVWSFVWLAHARFAIGAWDDAVAAAERAVSLLGQAGQEWLRPLVRLASVLVPAARGEWEIAEGHIRSGGSREGDYELMVVASALAKAQLAVARGDHEAVLSALEPVVAIELRAGVDEPGFWPWQDLYGDALISAGREDEADAFLIPHEELAEARERTSMVSRLARVRGRLDAVQGRLDLAEKDFDRALAAIEQLSMPLQRGLVELAYGQMLRRTGQRRAAATQLQAARERFAELGAMPYLQRCERELRGCGLSPAKRSDHDPSRLTAQEQAVARLVAVGKSNRQVASELFVSVKTVQFHLTHIYAKLGVGSRAELAARFRE